MRHLCTLLGTCSLAALSSVRSTLRGHTVALWTLTRLGLSWLPRLRCPSATRKKLNCLFQTPPNTAGYHGNSVAIVDLVGYAVGFRGELPWKNFVMSHAQGLNLVSRETRRSILFYQVWRSGRYRQDEGGALVACVPSTSGCLDTIWCSDLFLTSNLASVLEDFYRSIAVAPLALNTDVLGLSIHFLKVYIVLSSSPRNKPAACWT